MLRRTIKEGTIPRESALKGTDKKEAKFSLGNMEYVRLIVKNNVTPKAKKMPEDVELPVASPRFTPDRLVINLELTADAVQSTFPIELSIRYDQEDVQAAGGKEKLKLAYVDGAQWKIVSNVNWGSDFYATASIPDFPKDPPIATGH